MKKFMSFIILCCFSFNIYSMQKSYFSGENEKIEPRETRQFMAGFQRMRDLANDDIRLLTQNIQDFDEVNLILQRVALAGNLSQEEQANLTPIFERIDERVRHIAQNREARDNLVIDHLEPMEITPERTENHKSGTVFINKHKTTVLAMISTSMVTLLIKKIADSKEDSSKNQKKSKKEKEQVDSKS